MGDCLSRDDSNIYSATGGLSLSSIPIPELHPRAGPKQSFYITSATIGAFSKHLSEHFFLLNSRISFFISLIEPRLSLRMISVKVDPNHSSSSFHSFTRCKKSALSQSAWITCTLKLAGLLTMTRWRKPNFFIKILCVIVGTFKAIIAAVLESPSRSNSHIQIT